MNDSRTLSLLALGATGEQRLRALVDDHHAVLYRILRRLGVPDGRVEDAAQRVLLLVIARRLDTIELGAERSFLFAVALRTAADVRRSVARLREVHDDELLLAHRDPGQGADAALDDDRARELLDRVLGRLPIDLRVVFVLAVLEEMTMARIAELIEIPPGTVASRLRRARETFTTEARAEKARLESEEIR